MSAPAAVGNSSNWSGLLGLARHDVDERTILRGLLRRLCEECGWRGAEAELNGVDGAHGRVTAGALEGGGRGSREVVSCELPEGSLRYLPGPGARAPRTDELVAVAAAARAARLQARLERERFAVNYRGVGLEALYDVGLAIASTLDFEQLCEEILLRAVSLLDARRGVLYLLDGDGYRRVRTLGGSAAERVSADAPEVEALLAGRPGSEALVAGAEHLLGVPIEVERRPRGLLVVADKESRRGVGPFAAADRRTLGLFANQAAIALENARLHRDALEKERLERDIQLAAEIQRQLQPKTSPGIEGFEVTGWSRPARHVGGDYYNLVPRPGGRLAAVVADVSGKGMPAALMVSNAHSALHLLLDRAELGPDLFAALNRHILEASAPNKFITLMLTEMDPVDGVVRYVNAGHNPALLLRRDGGVEELPSGGLPLGLFPGSWSLASVTMRSGDLLCLYSDGITECESPRGEEFGTARLCELLSGAAGRTLPELVRGIEAATTAFAEGAPQGDDQTLVLARRA